MLSWLGAIVLPLNHVLFVIGADHVSYSELLGFITGGACVWYTVRSSVFNFPIGIANSAFFLVLFANASLWADASVQIIFIVLGFLGWVRWVRRLEDRSALTVGRATGRQLALCIAFVIAGTVILTLILSAASDAAPFWDALTTALSLAAQWLLNAKRVENWYFWIGADVIYVPLYFVKHLTLTAAIYSVFLGLCFIGLREWLRLESLPATPDAVPA